MYDLTRRLATALGGTNQPIQLIYAKGRELPSDLRDSERIAVRTTKVEELLPGSSVVVSTAAKLLTSVTRLAANEFDLIICDEAYQLMFKDCAPLFKLAPTFCIIGDPGQLPPTVRGVNTALFQANSARVYWSLPRELLRRFPSLPVLQMPVSMRLVADTVSLIQPALYPMLPFTSGTRLEDRRIGFSASSDGSKIDEVLDLLAAGASVVGLLLPASRRYLDEADQEIAELGASVVSRLVQRGVRWEGVRTLTPGDIGYVDAHIVSGAATRRALQRLDVSGTDVWPDTPEVYQGSQRPIVVMKHPLSGLTRLSEFDLSPGRMCVMLSRHQLGCILVSRDGVGDTLARHRQQSARLLATADEEWMGWRAHSLIWNELEARGRLWRLSGLSDG
jgi:hypothetical protein